MLLPAFPITTAVLTREATKAPEGQWAELTGLSVLSSVVVSLPEDKLRAWAKPPAAAGALESHETALQRVLLESRVILGPFAPSMMDTAIHWLDRGIRKVLITAESTDDGELQRVAAAASELPGSRVIVRLPVTVPSLVNADVQLEMPTIKSLQDKLRRLWPTIGGVVVSLHAPATVERAHEVLLTSALETIREALDEGALFAVEWPAVVESSSTVLSKIAALHHKGIQWLASARLDPPSDGEFVDAGRAFVTCLRSDRPDGLFTTVVVDEAGVALGLVYSSEESILAAFSSGRGVYYSRSRKGLWRKGESSGNYQELIQLDLDCDSDALRFMVRQSGAGFCHLNTRTCWGDATGLQSLQAMLESRLQEAPAGSYTKRLFEDPNLLRNKLVEEAQELAEAETTTHVAEEAADVMYFAMVRCVAAGATLTDVEKQLDMRSLKVKRRPGNAKAYRIDAAEEILKKQKQ